MSTTQPPTFIPPFPFRLLKKGYNWRIILNMKLDNLYLELWTGINWESITNLEEADAILYN